VSAVEQFIVDLSSPDVSTRVHAMFSLCEEPERAEPALVAQLCDVSVVSTGRAWAALTLGRLQRNAFGAVDALRATLDASDVDLRIAAIRALGQLKASEAVPDIARHLGDTAESAAAWLEDEATPAGVARVALEQIGTADSLAWLARGPAG
jgi:HEAT repeat protein